MRVFLGPMQLMINTSSCKYYCVRSCMYVRAQVCDTLPHMATVGRDSHGASHVCLPHHPAFSGHQITLLTHCTACMVLFFLLWDNQGEIFEYLGQRKRHNLYSNCFWYPGCKVVPKDKNCREKTT